MPPRLYKSGANRRLRDVIMIAKMVFHYGFIPYVIYLGYKQGANKDMPPFTPLTLLWHSP